MLELRDVSIYKELTKPGFTMSNHWQREEGRIHLGLHIYACSCDQLVRETLPYCKTNWWIK